MPDYNMDVDEDTVYMSRNKRRRTRSNYGRPVYKSKICLNPLTTTKAIVDVVYCHNVKLDVINLADHQGMQFSANSCYAPNSDNDAVGFHQPYMWDQYTNLYHTYKVVTSKISVKFINTGETKTDWLQCGIQLYPSSETPSSDNRLLAERGKGVYSTLGPLTSGHCVKVLNYSYSAKKEHTIHWMDSAYEAKTNANVVNKDNYHIYVAKINGNEVADPNACLVQVRITYRIIFTDPKSQALS